MNFIDQLKNQISNSISSLFNLTKQQQEAIHLELNVNKEPQFGDFSCNAAMILAKELKKNPKDVALQIIQNLQKDDQIKINVESFEVAGPGFINIFLTPACWNKTALELYKKKENYFNDDAVLNPKKFLLEFVSVNPTGPLHLGHGRGAIVGDVLTNILRFLGHEAIKEYYINDAGNQIANLGLSLLARCKQQLGIDAALPEEGYHGEYLIELAKECIKEYGKEVIEKDLSFFKGYATAKMLHMIKEDLDIYGVEFDDWFSELSLFKDGSVEKTLKILKDKNLVYEKDGALWFKSSEFGDDKDRVVKKQDDSYTYIASDIAYHKNKFDRGFDILIDIFGQDHHGYVKRLQATMAAIGYDPQMLQFILCQMVSLKKGEEALKMSKRAGNFITLRDIINIAGKDVARFFYLNRKTDAHLEFDLEIAIKRTDENPVFYIQYAYVRTGSVLIKAAMETDLGDFLNKDLSSEEFELYMGNIKTDEIELLRKIISLRVLLVDISKNYNTHSLAYYIFELAGQFHNYYAKNKIIDTTNMPLTKSRLLVLILLRNTLDLCLRLLGISRPQKM